MSLSFSDAVSLLALLLSLFTAFSVVLEKRVNFDVSSVFVRILSSNDPALHYALVSFSLCSSSALPLLVNRIRLRANSTSWVLPLLNPVFEATQTLDPALLKCLLASGELASAPLLPVLVPAHCAQRISLLVPLRLGDDTQALLESFLDLASLPNPAYSPETSARPISENLHNPLSLEFSVQVSPLERFLQKITFGKTRQAGIFLRHVHLDANHFSIF